MNLYTDRPTPLVEEAIFSLLCLLGPFVNKQVSVRAQALKSTSMIFVCLP